MLGAIAPRPIAFASTINKEGIPNLAPFSFFNAFGANPPTVVFSPSRSGRTNTTKDTFNNIQEVDEVVINVVSYSIVQQMNLASAEYPSDVDEFKKAGFTPVESERVRPFRVKESPASFECKVKQVIETGTEGGAGNLVICEILLMHISDEVLDANGHIDPQKIDLVGRMGGSYYTRAYGGAVFSLPKPPLELGIGVDSIPESIRLSKVLTGNDLGLLGGIHQLPDKLKAREVMLHDPEVKDIFDRFQNETESLEYHLHLHAQRLLGQREVEKAWKVLLTNA